MKLTLDYDKNALLLEDKDGTCNRKVIEVNPLMPYLTMVWDRRSIRLLSGRFDAGSSW